MHSCNFKFKKRNYTVLLYNILSYTKLNVIIELVLKSKVWYKAMWMLRIYEVDASNLT